MQSAAAELPSQLLERSRLLSESPAWLSMKVSGGRGRAVGAGAGVRVRVGSPNPNPHPHPHPHPHPQPHPHPRLAAAGGEGAAAAVAVAGLAGAAAAAAVGAAGRRRRWTSAATCPACRGFRQSRRSRGFGPSGSARAPIGYGRAASLAGCSGRTSLASSDLRLSPRGS